VVAALYITYVHPRILPNPPFEPRSRTPPILSVVQDLGNTNFSIHLPRTSFDRRATAQIVLRAVKSLGVDDAHVNDRNDICVGEYKMSLLFSDPLRPGLPLVMMEYVSGSAYKIVNSRAYHHGTMLISTQLGNLGELLRPNNVPSP
jgi:lipoate-protein ligase A